MASIPRTLSITVEQEVSTNSLGRQSLRVSSWVPRHAKFWLAQNSAQLVAPPAPASEKSMSAVHSARLSQTLPFFTAGQAAGLHHRSGGVVVTAEVLGVLGVLGASVLGALQ